MTLHDLIHHWPLDKLIGYGMMQKKSINQSVSCDYVNDRFNRKESALFINWGYISVPAGIYFYGDFTISVWFKLDQMNANARILDFGNAPNSNNIILAFTPTAKIFLAVYDSAKVVYLSSSDTILVNKWYHTAVVVNGTVGSIYLNGVLNFQGPTNVPRAVNRPFNYIGKSNSNNPLLQGTIDDLQIYNKSLGSSQINDIFRCGF